MATRAEASYSRPGRDGLDFWRGTLAPHWACCWLLTCITIRRDSSRVAPSEAGRSPQGEKVNKSGMTKVRSESKTFPLSSYHEDIRPQGARYVAICAALSISSPPAGHYYRCCCSSPAMPSLSTPICSASLATTTHRVSAGSRRSREETAPVARENTHVRPTNIRQGRDHH